MNKRYTIRVQVVEVNDAGEVTDWVYQDTLQWATESRRAVFLESESILSHANEDPPTDSTAIRPEP